MKKRVLFLLITVIFLFTYIFREHCAPGPTIIQQHPIDIVSIARNNHSYLFQLPDPKREQELRSRFDIEFDREADVKTAETVMHLQQLNRPQTGSITQAEALEDIGFLMDYLQNGYAGYAYFGGPERFDPIRTAMNDAV